MFCCEKRLRPNGNAKKKLSKAQCAKVCQGAHSCRSLAMHASCKALRPLSDDYRKGGKGHFCNDSKHDKKPVEDSATVHPSQRLSK